MHEVAEIGEESSSESLRRNESSMNERAIAGDAHKASTDVYGGQAITVTLLNIFFYIPNINRYISKFFI